MTSLKYQFKNPPFAHQRQALTRGYDRPYFAYLMEMGTGKSKVTVDDFGIHVMQGHTDRMLLIAPINNYEDWIDKHFAEEFPYEFRGHRYKGMGTVREREQFGFLMQSPLPKLLCVNIEALSRETSAAHATIREFMAGQSVFMTVDESTTIKNIGAQRTRAVDRIGARASFRRILTGSPVTQSPLECYSQFHFLSPGIFGNRSYQTFKHRYCLMKKVDPNSPRSAEFPVAYRHLDELRVNVQTHSFRVLKQDCLDLPQKTYVLRKVPMNSQQEQLYIDMRKTAVAQLDEMVVVTAPEAMTRALRLHQISCGHLVTDDGTIVDVGDGKIEELLHIAEETASQIVVWSRFKHDIRRIVRALDKKYGRGSTVEFHGDVDVEQRKTNKAMFMAGDARFFVGTQATGGRALNELVVSDVSVYFSNDFSLERRQQSEDRTHRIGQRSNKCLYVDLATPGTIDLKIIESLRKNIDVASQITGDTYREWLI